uniref:FBD domain-containing protein n=2 Tax=Setaria italica TaxID=4555 RepID=K3Y3K4_SETIT
MAQLLGASSSKKRRPGSAAADPGPAPLKPAIRTGALSTRWPALWARRWPAPSSLDLHLRPGDDPEELLRSLECRGRRRLDRFSLTIHPYRSPLLPRVTDPQRFLHYAVACGVEDLHIDAADHFVSSVSTFTFPPDCSRLARLFVRHAGGLSSGSCFSHCSDAFPTLEVVHLHLLGSTLYIRRCNCEGVINLKPHLRSLTVADCNLTTQLDASTASGTYISLRGQNCNPIKHRIQALPGLANLRVLTICSIALQRVYALDRFGSATCLTKLSYLPSLRELQLVMLEMDYTNLAHMYAFFRCCQCPQLERLFVQLPSSSHDISVDISLEVSEEDEPDEELYEDDDPDGEEDEPVEELSEGYEAEEELLLEQLSEEYMLKERLYYEDVYEEDLPEENVPEDEQFEEDVPEGEHSEEDVPEGEQSEDDVPLYGLNNLIFAKLMKFKGHYFEMRLVSFLLRRATGLQKLLLVPPVGVGNYMEALEEPLDTSRFLDTILDFEKASPDAQIVLSDSDPTAIQQVHSDVS